MKSLVFVALLLTVLNATEMFLPEETELDIAKAPFEINLLGSSLPCSICDKVVGFAIGKITKYGCGILAKVEMAAACEAAGLGPEDPLSDICVVALVGACGEIAKLIVEHVQDPAVICQKVHLCS